MDKVINKEWKAIDYRIQRRNNLNEVFECTNVEFTQNDVPHLYRIGRYDEKYNRVFETDILFQKGPRNEPDSLAGVTEMDLLEIARHRIAAHQQTTFKTREGATALTKLEECIMWLTKRADDRFERGVLGTNTK